MLWRFSGLASLHWKHFDGDWVIYDEGSGQTLAADPLLAATLMALESGCGTFAEIEGQVLQDLQSNPSAELTTQLADGLMFLQQLGLVAAETL